tara:strand:+ start:241 stop:1167 length:927 start_codon:yes stop_codon:yes gene_type:complete
MSYRKFKYFEKLKNNLNIRNYTPHKGWLEFFTGSELIGWVYISGKEINAIRLIYQNRVLAETSITEERYDVREELDINISTGFRLSISNLNEKVDINKLIFEVSDSNKKYYVKLKFLKKHRNIKFLNPYNFNQQIFQGSIDDYETINSITGWAYSNKKYNIIWMQTNDKTPLEIKCDKFREDLFGLFPSSYCGFELFISDLDESYFEKEIWFTFDKEGKKLISQGETIILKSINISPQNDLLKNNQNDENFFLDNNSNLNEMILEANNFDNILKEIESNVDNLLAIKAKPVFRFPFSKFFYKKIFNKL